MKKNGFLTRESILAAKDLAFEIVEVDEWGGKVRVNAMTAARGGEYLKGAKDELSYDERFARMVVFTVSDESGEPLFKESDIPALIEKSLKPVYKLAKLAMKLNGMGSENL